MTTANADTENANIVKRGTVLRWWLASVIALTVVGVFCYLVAVPYLRARALVTSFKEGNDAVPTERAIRDGTSADSLRVYLRLPDCVAVDKEIAAALLGRYGKKGEKALLRTFEHGSVKARMGALWGLLEFDAKPSEWREPLLRLLRDDQPQVSRRAARTLALLMKRDTEWVDVAIGALEDNHVDTRTLGAYALGLAHESARRAVPQLMALLEKGTTRNRCHAAWALGEIRDKRALPALQEARKAGDSELAGSAADAIGKIRGDREVEELLKRLQDAEPEKEPAESPAK